MTKPPVLETRDALEARQNKKISRAFDLAAKAIPTLVGLFLLAGTVFGKADATRPDDGPRTRAQHHHVMK